LDYRNLFKIMLKIGFEVEGFKMLGWTEVLLILAVLVLVFGPSKLPKIAQDLGKAWREFTKASSGITEAAKPKIATNAKKESEIVIGMAEKLKIDTENKNAEQIANEIVLKAKTQGGKEINKEE
jgi:sec-independent protein translocase protein TatA